VHAIDIAPTVLEVAGVEPPTTLDGVAQRPIEGVSFGSSLDDVDAEEHHTTQYYEMFGCRALYHEGWKAVTYHDIQSDTPGLEHAQWELYDLRRDPSECHDLAGEQPERLQVLVDRWWEEAERYQVLPIDNRPFSELVLSRPSEPPPRDRYELWPDRAPIPEDQAPNVRNRSHVVTAHVTVDDGVAPAGVLVVQGSVLGGWSFHLQADQTLCYVHNLSGLEEHRVEASVALSTGRHELTFRYQPGEPTTVTLLVDGSEVGRGPIARPTWSRFSLTGAGLTVGYATGIPPADRDYAAPFRFTGTLERVLVELAGEPSIDPDAEAAAAIARQ